MIEQVLSKLECRFGGEDLPNVDPADRLCVVRSTVFACATSQNADGTERIEVRRWEGDVVTPSRKNDPAVSFANRDELARILRDVL